MRVLATILFFPLLWLRGFVSFFFGLISGVATVALFVLAIAAWFLPRNSLQLYLRYVPLHHGHLQYWWLVALALGLAFGSFMARYFYDWVLLRLNWIRTGSMRPWRAA
jgi:H+/Cl- antiporter ClcA